MAALTRMNWTAPRVLAAAAFGLGLVAMAGNPVRGHVVTVDTQQLATAVAGTVDHVTPEQLAGWIIARASDYRLIDLREPSAYATYHIPTAENVPLAKLPDWGLGRNEKIVLYSDGGIHAAQAWMLLRVQGYAGVTTLFGGLEGWTSEVVFPVIPASPTPQEAADFHRVLEVAKFFGGQGRAATGATAMPELRPMAPAAPATGPAPAASGKGPTAKKKKEGC